MKSHKNRKTNRPVLFLVTALLASQPISAYAATFADMNNVPWPGAETSIQKAAELGLVVGETVNGKHISARVILYPFANLHSLPIN